MKIILAPRTCFSNKTEKYNKGKQTNARKTSKRYTRQTFLSTEKVMVSLLTSGVKLLTLFGNSCCHSLLLPLLRWSRELLESSGLLWGSWLIFLVVYPDVWLKYNTLLLRACAVKAQKKRPTLAWKRTTSSLFVDSVRDTPGSSDPVPIAGNRRGVPGSSNSYRPRVTVAARYHIVAAQAVKGQFPSLVPRRQLSFQVWIRHEYVAISDWTSCCKREVLKQGWYESAVHPFRLLYQHSRSRPTRGQSARPKIPLATFSPSRGILKKYILCRHKIVNPPDGLKPCMPCRGKTYKIPLAFF